jgi:hypothetical protein
MSSSTSIPLNDSTSESGWLKSACRAFAPAAVYSASEAGVRLKSTTS